MQVVVRGLRATGAPITRKMLVEIIEDFANKYPKIKRMDKIEIVFKTRVRHAGQYWEGLLQGHRITVGTLTRKGRRFMTHEIVQIIYHELAHLTERGRVAECLAAKGGALSLYEEKDQRNEIRAMLISHQELAAWSIRQARWCETWELRMISGLLDKWPVPKP